MNEVDHQKLFARIAGELPPDLLEHVFVAGSLAAAYHFDRAARTVSDAATKRFMLTLVSTKSRFSTTDCSVRPCTATARPA